MAGRRVGDWLKQVIAAVLILAIFAGLMFLRLRGELGDAGILVYSGVILGYLLHAIKDVI